MPCSPIVVTPARVFIRALSHVLEHPAEFVIGCGLWFLAVSSKPLRNRCPIDVGVGPEPIVTHRYQKEAIRRQGYSAETFAQETYYITRDFDVCVSGPPKHGWLSTYMQRLIRAAWLFVHVIRQHRCVLMHFNGGPLSATRHLWRLEPWLLKQAGVRVIVSPYGSDIQDLRLANNLEFKQALIVDYPLAHRHNARVRLNLRRWTRRADHVISGCDWVDYMYHWNTLMLTDWCIDTADQSRAATTARTNDHILRVLHAPNHVTIKGTNHLQLAVDMLCSEGLKIELVLLERVPNHLVLEAIREVDLVADQFVIGWYGFFAVEAMASGKPVMTYLKPEYLDLQTFAGNIGPGGIPVVNTRYDQIVEQLRWAYWHRDELRDLGRRGREFVVHHHSLEAVGQRYASILRSLGIDPRPIPAASASGNAVQSADKHPESIPTSSVA